MKFCRSISVFDRIFYDPVSNLFLVNGVTVLEVSLGVEYKIQNAVEQAEIAGLSQDEILYIVSGILWNSYPKMHNI